MRKKLDKITKEEKQEIGNMPLNPNDNSILIEPRVGKNLPEEKGEKLMIWRHVLLTESQHILLKHILESGIKDKTLVSEGAKKLLRMVMIAEKHNIADGRKLTRLKLEELTKFIQERY